MAKIKDFSQLITYDNLGKFISAFLGGRHELIQTSPPTRSTMQPWMCKQCKRKRIENNWYCHNHLNKNKKKIVNMLINEHALSLRSSIDREQIEDKIKRIKRAAL
jgi:hypothetical protein